MKYEDMVKENKLMLSILSFGIWIASMLLKFHIIATLWGWFIVTKFALPTITMLEAFGIIMVVRLFTIPWVISEEMKKKTKISKREKIRDQTLIFVILIFVYGVAYTVHQCQIGGIN